MAETGGHGHLQPGRCRGIAAWRPDFPRPRVVGSHPSAATTSTRATGLRETDPYRRLSLSGGGFYNGLATPHPAHVGARTAEFATPRAME